MAEKDLRSFACTACKRVHYLRRAPIKKGVEREKLEMKKFCKFCRKHTLHKERSR